MYAPGDKILEIGTGSGYQAAILSELGLRYIPSNARKYCIIRRQPLLKRWAICLSVAI